MKKGFIAIVLVLAMALCFTAFAACMPDSPSEGDPSGGGSITAPEDPGGDSGSTGGDTDNPGGGSDTDNPGSGGDTDNPSDPGSGETGGETPGTDPSDPDDNPGGGEDNPGGSGEDPDAPGTGDNPGGGEDNPGSGEDPDDPDNPGTGDNPGGGITPDDPDGTHGEEAALRALLRSVTVDMESLSASGTLYQAGGGSSPMKVEMRADVAYDSDSGTGVYLSMKSSAVDDRDDDITDAQPSETYYGGGYTYTAGKTGDETVWYRSSYDPVTEKYIDSIFTGAYFDDFEKLTGVDPLSDWTFADITETAENLTVGDAAELVKYALSDYSAVIEEFFGRPMDEIFGLLTDGALGSLTVSDLFGVVMGVLGELDINHTDEKGVLADMADWIMTGMFDVSLTETSDGYTLTVTDNDIAGHLTSYLEELKPALGGTVNDLVETLVGVDLKSSLVGALFGLKKDTILADGVAMVDTALRQYGATIEDVYEIVDELTGMDTAQFISENGESTLDDFIIMVSDEALDFTKLVGQIDDVLDMKTADLISDMASGGSAAMPGEPDPGADSGDDVAVAVGGEADNPSSSSSGVGDQIVALINGTEIGKADFDMTVTYDGAMSVTGIALTVDVDFDVIVGEGEQQQNMGLEMYFDGGVTGFGATEVTLPSDYEDAQTIIDASALVFDDYIPFGGLFEGEDVVVSYEENAEGITDVTLSSVWYDYIDGEIYGENSLDVDSLSDCIVIDTEAKTVTVKSGIVDLIAAENISEPLVGIEILLSVKGEGFDGYASFTLESLLADGGKPSPTYVSAGGYDNAGSALLAGEEVTYTMDGTLYYEYDGTSWQCVAITEEHAADGYPNAKFEGVGYLKDSVLVTENWSLDGSSGYIGITVSDGTVTVTIDPGFMENRADIEILSGKLTVSYPGLHTSENVTVSVR